MWHNVDKIFISQGYRKKWTRPSDGSIRRDRRPHAKLSGSSDLTKRLATSRAFTAQAWRGRQAGAVTDPGDPAVCGAGSPTGLEGGSRGPAETPLSFLISLACLPRVRPNWKPERVGAYWCLFSPFSFLIQNQWKRMESGSAGPNERIQYRCAGDKHRINDKVLVLPSSYPVKLNITKMAPPKFINYPSNKSI